MTKPPAESDLARVVEELSQLRLEHAGGTARLEFLHPSHAPSLFEAAQSEAIWRWKTESMPTSISETEVMIAESLAMIDNHSPRGAPSAFQARIRRAANRRRAYPAQPQNQQ